MLIICVKHRLRFRLILRNLVWKHNYRKQWSEKWWPETQFFSLFIYGQGTVCSSVYVFFFSFFVCFISVISIFLGQLPRNASLLFTHTLKSSWKQPQHIPIVGFFFLKKQSLWSFSFIRYKTLQAVLQLRQSSLCTYQRPSRGVDSGTYGEIARDLLTFVANFWPGTGPSDRFCASEARYTGKDPRDL